MLQHNIFRTEQMLKSLVFFSRKKAIASIKWYGEAMLAVLEDSSVKNKGTIVKTNVKSKSCLLCYVICYATASVRKVTEATVC
jgi:hypothetical protein